MKGPIKLLVWILLPLSLAGCDTFKDPKAVIVSLESGYGAGLAAEITYLSAAAPDPVVVKKIADARAAVARVLMPLADAAAQGKEPATTDLVVAQAALAGFQETLRAAGLLPAGGQ